MTKGMTDRACRGQLGRLGVEIDIVPVATRVHEAFKLGPLHASMPTGAIARQVAAADPGADRGFVDSCQLCCVNDRQIGVGAAFTVNV